MGVAFTIKAPIPPVPVEEKPKQEGRCPNNPMWTTRFPTTENWYPVMMDAVTARTQPVEKQGWCPRHTVAVVSATGLEGHHG